MAQTLVVNSGEFEFTNFDKAVKTLQEEYGYEGFGMGNGSSQWRF